MRFLRTLSKILIVLPLVTLVYDLVKEWFVNARIWVRSVQEWWNWMDSESLTAAKPFLNKLLTPEGVTKLMQWPMPFALLIPPVVLYLIYWVWFKIKGGHGAGRMIFRSHD